MKKKSDKVEKEVERDDEDEDEDDVENDDDSVEGEEEQDRPAVSARAVADERRARRAAAARAPQKGAAHDDHGHGHGHDHDDEDESNEGEDPSWWAPHAVMSALVLIGVLGFFGLFNKILAPIAAHPAGQTETAKEESKPAEPSKAPTPTPQAPQPPQAPREMFAAKHLLVMYKGGKRAPESVTRTKEEAKARATEAQKKAKEGKTKFEDLVKEYSDEPRAGERGGDLGTFPKGSMVPEFQAGLEKIKIGEISDVVESPFGYHVILRTQPNQPAMPPGH